MRTHCLIACICGICLAMMAITAAPAFAETGTALQPSPYRLNRADEDYRFLADPARNTDIWDPLKYIPFNRTGSWYLSIGGEARE